MPQIKLQQLSASKSLTSNGCKTPPLLSILQSCNTQGQRTSSLAAFAPRKAAPEKPRPKRTQSGGGECTEEELKKRVGWLNDSKNIRVIISSSVIKYQLLCSEDNYMSKFNSESYDSMTQSSLLKRASSEPHTRTTLLRSLWVILKKTSPTESWNTWIAVSEKVLENLFDICGLTASWLTLFALYLA